MLYKYTEQKSNNRHVPNHAISSLKFAIHPILFQSYFDFIA